MARDSTDGSFNDLPQITQIQAYFVTKSQPKKEKISNRIFFDLTTIKYRYNIGLTFSVYFISQQRSREKV